MTYLDTSAMIRAWRQKLAPEAITRTHSVAEFYATLTGGLTVLIEGVQTRVKFPPADIAKGAKETFAKMRFKDLTGKEALNALDTAAAKNVQSANVHDLMHAVAAASAGCKEIVTTNEKHFRTVTNLKLIDPTIFFAAAK